MEKQNRIEPLQFEAMYPDDARTVEIGKILRFVQGGNSCQLVGLAGTGRANLLKLLAYNKKVRLKHLGENQKWMHFVLVSFPEIRRRNLYDTTKFLFLSLTDSLRERGMQEAYQEAMGILKDSLLLDDEMVLFQGLKRTIDLLAIEKELTIVFLFDRFEEYVPVVTSEFFANLRVLRNRAKYRFSIIFSLNKPLEELVEPALFAEFHEFVAGHVVYLRLSDPVVTDFRIHYLEKLTGKQLASQQKELILSLTAGHGKLTRLSVEAVLAAEDSVSLPNEQDAFMQWLYTHRTIRGALKEIWRSLSPQEQQWLEDGCPADAEHVIISDYFTNPGLVK